MGNLFSWLSAEDPLRGITAARYVQILNWKTHYNLSTTKQTFGEYIDSYPAKGYKAFIRKNLEAGKYDESDEDVSANEGKLKEEDYELLQRFKAREDKYFSKERKNYATRSRARGRQNKLTSKRNIVF